MDDQSPLPNEENHGGFKTREEFLNHQHREQMRLNQEQHEREMADSNASTIGFIAMGVIIFIVIALGLTDK